MRSRFSYDGSTVGVANQYDFTFDVVENFSNTVSIAMKVLERALIAAVAGQIDCDRPDAGTFKQGYDLFERPSAVPSTGDEHNGLGHIESNLTVLPELPSAFSTGTPLTLKGRFRNVAEAMVHSSTRDLATGMDHEFKGW